MTSQRTTSQRTTSVRLGSFALILAGTFGAAYAIGERLPGHHHPAGSKHNHAQGGATSAVVSDAVGAVVTVPFTVVPP